MKKSYRTYPRRATEPLSGAGIARSHRNARQRIALAKALHSGDLVVAKLTEAQAAFVAGVPLRELHEALIAGRRKAVTKDSENSPPHSPVHVADEHDLGVMVQVGKPNGRLALPAPVAAE